MLEENRICIQNNKNASFVNLDAENNFKNMSLDLSVHDCQHLPLKEIVYPFIK